jgi:hypothetical protein
MRNLLLTAATGALLLAAVPASAQVYMGAEPYGAGVQSVHSALVSGRGMTMVGVAANTMPMAPTVRW